MRETGVSTSDRFRIAAFMDFGAMITLQVGHAVLHARAAVVAHMSHPDLPTELCLLLAAPDVRRCQCEAAGSAVGPLSV